MEYLKELSVNPKIKSYFKSLIGLKIEDAVKKLGYWWTLSNCHVNWNTGRYDFYRAGGGRIELQTENNIVISENHNGMAMVYAKMDLLI